MVNVSSAWVWSTGWFFSWSCNTLTASMSCLAILVDSSFGVSIGTWLCCGYNFYLLETWITPVVGTCNLGTCSGPKRGLCIMPIMLCPTWTSYSQEIEDSYSCFRRVPWVSIEVMCPFQYLVCRELWVEFWCPKEIEWVLGLDEEVCPLNLVQQRNYS